MFKIGDKVKVVNQIGEDCLDDFVEVGDIGLVLEIDKNEKYSIIVNIEGFSVRFLEEELEII